MAFVVSNRELRDRDIKYIYSDQTIHFVYPKRRSFLPLKEERPLPPLKKYPRRFYEYYPRMNIGLPRAPAFRQAESGEIDRIVNRICKPIQCQKARRRDLIQEEDEHETDEHERKLNEDGSETERSTDSKGKMSSQELSELIARLQKPTESSRKKEYKHRKLEDAKRDEWKTKIPKLPPIDPIY